MTLAERVGLQPGEPVAAAGAAEENRELVADESAATSGQDRWAAGETRPVLLATPGGEPFDETFIFQHAGADRWTAASVGIDQGATPKKTSPISPRNGEVSEKTGSGSRGDRLSGPGKGRLGGDGTVWEKKPCRRVRLEANGCLLATAGRPKN